MAAPSNILEAEMEAPWDLVMPVVDLVIELVIELVDRLDHRVGFFFHSMQEVEMEKDGKMLTSDPDGCLEEERW